jgi:hypothetical protein
MDPDPHQSQNSEAVDAPNEAEEGPLVADLHHFYEERDTESH